MKMRAPQDVTAFSHAGTSLEIVDGVVKAQDHQIADLLAHGFQPADVQDQAIVRADPETLSREQIISTLLAGVRTEMEKQSTDDLRGALDQMRNQALDRVNGAEDDLDATPPDFDPMAVKVEDLAGMKRGPICAVIKARGVAYTLPKTNDELRAIAAKAIEAQA